jgi:PAS domain S-box-containing protein
MLSNTEKPDFSAGNFYQTDNQLKRLFMQSQSLMAILRWREGVCELINPMFKGLWANRDVLNKPMREAWPELGHHFFKKVEQVYDTGKTGHSYEYAVKIKEDDHLDDTEAFFDLMYSPYSNQQGDIEGVMIMGFDVTAKVLARRELAEQQLLFKDITNAAGTALWTVDTRGNITFVNQTWIDWTGSPYEAHLGRGWMEYVQPEDRDRVISSYIRDVNRKTQYEVDFRVLRSDGETQWVAATGKPRYLPSGEFAGYVGSCMDITERKMSEQMLKESEERFRTIADSAPVLIWMTGTNKHTTFLNKSWMHYGSEMQLLSDTSYMQSDLLHEQDRDRAVDTYIQAFDARREFYMEYRMKSCYDDRYRWIGMKGVPCIGADGTFEGYIGSGMDITGMKEHEQIKNDFIGMASHELKTPITSIKAYIQLLLTIYKNKTNDDFLMKSLNTVNKQINKLTRLITDLLDVSKMETGRLSLNCEPFILNDLLKEIVEEVQHTATQHDIVLVTPPKVNIHADRDRIGQVITNFLTNAIKYSPESDRVEVHLSVNNNEARIAVHDYGIGISPDEQSKIFNRFYRVEGRNEQTFSGFGIGLYVAAEIVKRHNGNVWVESQKDKGSTFYFTIPLSSNH